MTMDSNNIEARADSTQRNVSVEFQIHAIVSELFRELGALRQELREVTYNSHEIRLRLAEKFSEVAFKPNEHLKDITIAAIDRLSANSPTFFGKKAFVREVVAAVQGLVETVTPHLQANTAIGGQMASQLMQPLQAPLLQYPMVPYLPAAGYNYGLPAPPMAYGQPYGQFGMQPQVGAFPGNGQIVLDLRGLSPEAVRAFQEALARIPSGR